MILTIPVAWLQLIREKIRFLVTLTGMTFAVVLIFMQLGFQDALYNSATEMHQSLRGDLFMISTQYKALTSQQSFTRSRLYQTLGIKGVSSISPVYLQFAMLKNPITGQKYALNVFGIVPEQSPFTLPEVNLQIEQLKYPNQALFDQESRTEFGPLVEHFRIGKDVTIELSSYNEVTTSNRIKVVGLFTLGPSFGVDGNLIVNISTFLNAFQDRQVDKIDIGAINLTPGVNPQVIQASLGRYLPVDVQILTREEFVALEQAYWARRTPIGFVFSLMVTVGFSVGIVIVYQILYSNISDHLDEYATLKAMGYTDFSLLAVVYQQSLIIAAFGYGVGFLISLALYQLAHTITHLPIAMNPSQMALVFLFSIGICFISSTIAMNRLRYADPADIF
jgi:putative ABC transport system permease protein